MGCLFCDSLPVALAVQGKTEQGPLALPPVCTSLKVCVPSRVGMEREGRARAGYCLPTWVLQRWGGGFDFFTVGRGPTGGEGSPAGTETHGVCMGLLCPFSRAAWPQGSG